MSIKSFALKASAAMMMAVGMYACSSSDNDGLYDYMSADQSVYLSLNLNDIFDNAGFEVTPDGVKPSEAFLKLVDGEESDNKVMKIMDMRGVDLDNVIVMYDFSNNQGDATAVFAISDKDKFASYLQDNEMTPTDENGMQVYTLKGNDAIVIDGEYGLITSVQGSASAKVKTIKEAATNEPLKSWQKEALTKNNALSAVVNIKDLYDMSNQRGVPDMPDLSKFGFPEGKDAYGVFTSKLSGLEWEGIATCYDADGKKVKFDIDFYPVAKSLLDYTDSNDIMVALFAMPKDIDYASILKEMGVGGASSQAADVLNSLRSVMFAVGPLDITGFNSPDGWTGVLAIQLEKGMAQEYLNMAKMMAGQFGLPVQKSENGMSVKYGGINASLKAEGDNLVLFYNTPSDAGKSAFKASDFGDLGGFMIDVPANTPSVTMTSMPFGINLKMESDGMDCSKGCLKLTDTKGKLLENIIEFAASKQ